jgi:O-antigen/teichoic acid export membrane protein
MKKFLFVLLLCLVLTACAPTHSGEIQSRNVFYAGESGALEKALALAGFQMVQNPAQADVIVLNGQIPASSEVADAIRTGAGLILIPGTDTRQDQIQSLLGVKATLTSEDDPLSLVETKTNKAEGFNLWKWATGLFGAKQAQPDQQNQIPAGKKDQLTSEIIWNGAPQVRERSRVEGLPAGADSLVSGYEKPEGVLWYLPPGTIAPKAGGVYLLTAWLSGEANPQIQEWGYFNYLIYSLVERATGGTPLSFADYPGSPVPHQQDRSTLLIFLASELVLFFGAFIIVRRWSLRHPEALDTIVADKTKFTQMEASTDWEKVGFHRPLSGLLVGMGIGIILFIPLIIYQNLILPQFILPSAQALGMWGRVTQFFGLTWALFDLGTSTAAMKFLSQHRVEDPARGFKYIQVYLWWQALSGAVQVALVVMLASMGIVRTPYALFTWSILIHTMVQIPGFYGVFRTTLNGLQRNDYARYLDAAWAIAWPIVTQLALVPIFYSWGKSNPAMGASMGGLIGLGMAAYAVELCNFLLGMWLYRRIGYKVSILFMAHFNWQIIKETFRFGFFEMLGGMTVAAGSALEIWITQSGLVNYSEAWGNWILAGNFLLAFTVSTNLFDGIMPAISEALSSGYKKLSQYYSVQSYKWGAITSSVLGAVLLVTAPRFILGSSGPEFHRAAALAVPLTIFGAIQFFGWLGDAIFLGSNRPALRAVMILIEQTIRILLLVALLNRYQIEALVIAYFTGILIRGIVAYFVADRYCFPQKIYFWQTLAAPLISAAAQYFFLSLIAKLVWQGDDISSIVLFFIGLLPAMPVFFFFYALAGGWDDAGLEEIAEASQMSGFLRPVVKIVFTFPSRWGARLSPLHGRFPIKMRPLAMEEARLLTEERVKLVHG